MSGCFRRFRFGSAVCLVVMGVALAAASAEQGQTQSQSQTGTAAVQGYFLDAAGKPLADAAVFLQRAPETTATLPDSRTMHTNSNGAFRFAGLREGTYTVRGEPKGGCDKTVDSVKLARNETKKVILVLQCEASAAAKLQFFDEPQFTVAGITQATNSGGHGSDAVLRNSEALVKDTAALGREPSAKQASARIEKADEAAGRKAGSGSLKSATQNAAIEDSRETSELVQEGAEVQAEILRREKVEGGKVLSGSVTPDKAVSEHLPDAPTRQKQSELYRRLAQIDEKLSNPLEAVREYQRAAELTPSETNIFDWASELLTHRALEPATEVFTKGNALYPQSARMLIGLGVSWYARGSYERAAQYLGSASDLAPGDETPYLFMGRMQSEETVPSQETLARLARFQRLEPGNALANYYYAVSLWKWKQSTGALDDASSAEVEALLQKAIQIDLRLGAAQLQLGILYALRGDYPRAIPAYQKAVEISPELEEAHYRLAQAYKRNGEEARAQKELQIHEQLAKQAKEQAERERNEIQQFVISLRDGTGQER